MTFKVLIADSLPKRGLEAFDQSDTVQVDDRAGISREELLAIIPNYQGLVVRSRTKANAEVIEAGTDLRVIGRAGIGVDNIDLNAATRAGVVVMNTPDGNATTTAEHTISLLFSLARMIPQATASMKAGRWDKKKFTGQELAGKTLGILGLGNIGRIVASRAQGLRMKVVGFDPYFHGEKAQKLDIELLPLEGVIGKADIITVHTPLNDETRGLIDDAQVERMKPGVLLINCARGGIYDEGALLRGLDSGKIGGVALDVFETEPPAADHPLVRHERVVCTPHLGASTTEAQVQVAVDIAKQISEFAEGGPAKNAINMPRISAGELKQLLPFLDLAGRMASFLAQLHEGALESVEVRVAGAVAEGNVALITTAAAAGALSHAFDRPVNAVNAGVLAKERGIEIIEARSNETAHTYASTLSIAVSGKEGRTHSVMGAVFDGVEGRFVVVDGVPLEAVPEGYLLFLKNRDKPGVIGFIGKALGDAGINVSRMHLGLDRENQTASSLVNVDAPVPADVLAQMQRDSDVTFVKQVKL